MKPKSFLLLPLSSPLPLRYDYNSSYFNNIGNGYRHEQWCFRILWVDQSVRLRLWDRRQMLAHGTDGLHVLGKKIHWTFIYDG